MQIAIITSCVAGIAHSKMAAKVLKKEAESRGCEVFIEEQGGHKIPKRLTEKQIRDSDIIIIAKAISISGMERFLGKKILDLHVNEALKNPKETIDKAIALI